MTSLTHDLTTLFHNLAPSASVAWHDGALVDGDRLRRDVAHRTSALRAHPARDWAVFYHHGYPALVTLLALWQAGKRAWLPGNNQPATGKALAAYCQAFAGDWPTPERLDTADPAPLTETDADTELVIFTSGSSGAPKPIFKRYRQLLNELRTLETAFGAGLDNALFVGTVSHQHIYGLLFRLLWPLAAGRPLCSEAFQDPAGILRLAARGPLAWVASPAHLKRLRDDLPWDPAAPPRAIFSSGGPLPAASASHLAAHAGVPATEVYGASETGGIGWRRQPPDDGPWTLLPGLALARQADRTRLLSPHVDGGEVSLDDHLELLGERRFRLGGRRDRVVKVEEKRIALAQVEQALTGHPAVAEARVLQPPGEQRLGAVLVLTPAGARQLDDLGRAAITTALREHLAARLEPLAIPRRWRLVARLPETAQGKVPMAALEALFSSSRQQLPDIEESVKDDRGLTLTLRVDTRLPWFRGHFEAQGVLPGVVQIDWAEAFARRYFPLPAGPHHLEVIKFNNLILPGQELHLTLDWKPATGKLAFAFHSSRGPHSSGRLAFKEPV